MKIGSLFFVFPYPTDKEPAKEKGRNRYGEEKENTIFASKETNAFH